MAEFTNKVVIVTGSSAGIGESTAIEFAKLGAKVVITGRSTDKLKAVEKKCQAAAGSGGAGKILVVTADVTNDADLKRLVDTTISEFGQIDVLVNNAGAGATTSIFDPNVIQTYENTMNINMRSVYVLTHLAIPHLVKTKGNIINISSVGGTKPFGIFAPYCMAKAALDMFTKCLALEVGPHGVRVNCVKPGPVRTNFVAAMGFPKTMEDKLYEDQEKSLPMGRVGAPEDIAHLIVFLASPKSINMTGTLVMSDSGSLWSSADIKL